MTRASLVLRRKEIDDEGNLVELAIWRVPVTPQTPVGIRYRLAFVRRDTRAPAVLYDNHPPKGHHRHIEGVEEVYRFVDVDQLLSDFVADMKQLTGKH